ncbi:hypothetical protein TB2_014054 [Malus domestica]
MLLFMQYPTEVIFVANEGTAVELQSNQLLTIYNLPNFIGSGLNAGLQSKENASVLINVKQRFLCSSLLLDTQALIFFSPKFRWLT